MLVAAAPPSAIMGRVLGPGLLVTVALAVATDAAPPAEPGDARAPSAGAGRSAQVRAPSAPVAAVPDDLTAPAVEPELRSWLVPAVEVLGISAVIWRVDVLRGEDFADISHETIASNLGSRWCYDDDDFHTNLFLHPYQGSLYFTAVRSSGGSFWLSAPYAIGGSLLWEYAMEVQRPSINDQIATSFGGIVLGEALFRVSRIVLPWSAPGSPQRALGAAAIAPMAGANRLLLGGRPLAAEPAPQRWRGRVQLGASAGRLSGTERDVRMPVQGRVGIEITGGLPEEVRLREPFDHFHASLDFVSSTLQPWNELDGPSGPSWALSVRGLVAGGASPLGDRGRILGGLFGTADYSGPTTFRAASTGLGPGIVLAGRGDGGAAEATLVASGVFGSAGGRTPEVVDRDYRYGFGGLLVGDLRLSLRDRLELRGQARAHLVAHAEEGSGSEDFVVASASAIVRIVGPHAVAVDGALSERRVRYLDAAYHESTRSAGISYTLLLGGSGE